MNHRLVETIDRATQVGIDALCAVAPNAHFTQHPAWAAVPADDAHGRWLFLVGEETGRVRAAALLRVRRTPLLGCVLADIFRGPMADSPAALLEAALALQDLIAPMRPLALRLDPFWSGEGGAEVREGLSRLGYAPMREPPWSARTLAVEIDKDPDQLMLSFRKETRYDVRKALKLQLDVHEDLDDGALESFVALYRRMIETKGANRRPEGFFRAVRDYFRAWPQRGFFLGSWMQGELLGAIAVFTMGRRAIYGYGASSQSQPGVPKTHLLHYEAMRRARARGCALYDMGGFGAGTGTSDARTPAQKINYFKSGFGGREVDFVQAHERVVRPLAYRIVRRARRMLS